MRRYDDELVNVDTLPINVHELGSRHPRERGDPQAKLDTCVRRYDDELIKLRSMTA